MKKKLVFILFLFIFVKTGLAQQDDFGWRVSAGYGYTNYYGDVSNYDISLKNADNIFKLYRLDTRNINFSDLNKSMLNSYSFAIERKWSRTISFIGQYSHNTISGNDRNDLDGKLSPSNPNFARALNFKSELNDFSVGLVFRSDNDWLLRSSAFIAPYLSLTAGYTFFNTKADLFDSGGNRYDYSPDGTIAGAAIQDGSYETNLESLMTEGKRYDSNAFNLGLGLGLRFRLTSRLGLHIESTMHYLFTDYLDDVSGDYPSDYQNNLQAYASNPTGVVRNGRGNSNTNDVFVYHALSLRYSFGAPEKRVFHAPVFNPNSHLNELIVPTPTLIESNDSTIHVPDTLVAPVVQPVEIMDELTEVKAEPQNNDTLNYKTLNYDIRIIRKDGVDNQTNIRIHQGSITDISTQNSDVFIRDHYQGHDVSRLSVSDTLRSIKPMVRKYTKIELVGDSVYEKAKKVERAVLNSGTILSDTLTHKSIIPVSKADSLTPLRSSLKSYRQNEMIVDTINIRDINESLYKQDTLSLKLDNQIEDVSVILARMHARVDSLYKITQLQNELLALEQHRSSSMNKIVRDTVTLFKEAVVDTLPAIQHIVNFRSPATQEQLNAPNDPYNSEYYNKLLLLSQSQNRLNTDYSNHLDYQETLRRIQEINYLRSQQSNENAQLKQEFLTLSRKIDEHENSNMNALQSYVDESDSQNKQLQDSILLLHSQIEQMKQQMVRLSEEPALAPEIINVVNPLDIESIPVVEIFFGSGETKVSQTGIDKITQVAKVLTKYRDFKVILSGMADATGNRERNIKLSLQRAEAVKNILVNKHDIVSDRIKTNALGTFTSQGKNALDRKVRVKVVKSF